MQTAFSLGVIVLDIAASLFQMSLHANRIRDMASCFSSEENNVFFPFCGSLSESVSSSVCKCKRKIFAPGRGSPLQPRG